VSYNTQACDKSKLRGYTSRCTTGVGWPAGSVSWWA
jgi:hypothetical protein